MSDTSKLQVRLPRVALDTCVVRNFVHGDAEVKDLAGLTGTDALLSLTGPALFEFVLALHEGRESWDA